MDSLISFPYLLALHAVYLGVNMTHGNRGVTTLCIMHLSLLESGELNMVP